MWEEGAVDEIMRFRIQIVVQRSGEGGKRGKNKGELERGKKALQSVGKLKRKGDIEDQNKEREKKKRREPVPRSFHVTHGSSAINLPMLYLE